MTEKSEILKGVHAALLCTTYGKIKLETQTSRELIESKVLTVNPVNLLVEKRTRFPAGTSKQEIVDAVSAILDTGLKGRITIELRGEKNSIDVVVEQRTQYTQEHTKKDYNRG